MNFQNATAAEWAAAHRMLAGAARASGYEHHTAEDLAAEAVLRILTVRWTTPPESVRHAAVILRNAARRRGWAMFDRTAAAAAERRRRDEKADAEGRPRPPRPVMDRSGSITPSPADMAEHAEHHGIPVYRVHEAHGIGPGALAEPGQTPSVYGSGPATPPPVTGCRWVHIETDPNAERTLAQRQPLQYLEGYSLADYRQRLAEARGDIPPRPTMPPSGRKVTRQEQIDAGLIIPRS